MVSHRKTELHFLLDNLQSPMNIGKCARIAEVYGIHLHVHDPRGTTQSLDALRILEDFSCGAWGRNNTKVFRDINECVMNNKKGRLIATCLRQDAVRLPDFEFREDDVIILGNEYDGVDEELIDGADQRIYIPMPVQHLPKRRSHIPIDPVRIHEVRQNGVTSLNVAVAAGIVGYAYSCWQEKNAAQAFEKARARLGKSSIDQDFRYAVNA